jgi:glycosyltransferase involved in cell wall biosynthesis
VTGRVPDVRPYLARSACSVAPIRIGAGVQNKVLESLAMGVPVVCTSVAAEGLNVRDGRELLIADGPEQTAEKVVRVLRYRDLREQLATLGRQAIERHFSWEAKLAPYEQLLYRDPCPRPSNQTQGI